MSKFLDSLKSLLIGAGAVIDAAIPVANGDRTKISALFAVAAPVVCTALTPVFPAACPVVSGLGQLAAAAVPIFAATGLLRKLKLQ